MKIKIVNKSDNPLPKYETGQAAGLDLRAYLAEPIVLKPMERKLVPTGLSMEIPAGYEGQVRPRSGFAIKSGVTVLNSPGTIDADYRGEVKVILINLSNQEHEISSGDRIAQLVIAAHERAEFVEVQELSDSQRGERGFGSTGKQ